MHRSATMLLLLLGAAAAAAGPASYGRVKDLPGYDNSDVSWSGYIDEDGDNATAIHFWFHEARGGGDGKPVILWLQGGPGSAGSMGSFFQMGPYRVDRVDGEVRMSKREVSWTDEFNVLFVDQPVGTGLSYAPLLKLSVTLRSCADRMYSFMRTFYAQEDFAKFRANELYMVGEGFTGRFAPYFAQRWAGKADYKAVMNLKGLAVGDGWNAPCFQIGYWVEVAEVLGIITARQAAEARAVEQGPMRLACEAHDWLLAQSLSHVITFGIVGMAAGMPLYDSRRHEYRPHDYDYYPITEFMNNKTIRELLHVDRPEAADWKFVMNSTTVDYLMLPENFIDSSPWYTECLDKLGLRVLIYEGQNDPLWGPKAQLAWLDQLAWSGNRAWLHSKQKPFHVKDAAGEATGVPVGFHRQAGDNMQWAMIFNAGHSVPMDEPAAAFTMIKNFVYGREFV
eukprot:TRINITY_DN2219_c0_g1_i4.p1 TRINITY_DN2219_c0_g1~~TRINITY_DN2219_c0_g1_i4.p1  ORF type:complete len:451 (+),score=171.16 TRINITY_DN2219_c0_g1_i4:340-1692(+)